MKSKGPVNHSAAGVPTAPHVLLRGISASHPPPAPDPHLFSQFRFPAQSTRSPGTVPRHNPQTRPPQWASVQVWDTDVTSQEFSFSPREIWSYICLVASREQLQPTLVQFLQMRNPVLQSGRWNKAWRSDFSLESSSEESQLLSLWVCEILCFDSSVRDCNFSDQCCWYLLLTSAWNQSHWEKSITGQVQAGLGMHQYGYQCQTADWTSVYNMV